MKKLIIGFVAGVLIVLGVPAVLLAFGAIDMGASVGAGALERTLAEWAVDRSVDTRATSESNPYAEVPAAADAGLEHYRETCVLCHGAPGVNPNELATGLTPPAPSLVLAARHRTDGELFWITKHGIRMTGMPAFGGTHTDEEIWEIVAFLHHLSSLSKEQLAALKEAGTEEDHHRPSSPASSPEADR